MVHPARDLACGRPGSGLPGPALALLLDLPAPGILTAPGPVRIHVIEVLQSASAGVIPGVVFIGPLVTIGTSRFFL
jgi:hypothetical protein